MRHPWRTILCAIIVCATAAGADEVSAVRAQLEQLAGEFAAARKSYEERIAALEERLRKIESAPAESVPAQPAAAVRSGSGPSYLPDISMVGNILGDFGERRPELPDRNRILLEELELGLQGYLHPNVRADAFIALHRHDEGEYEAELEEGYVSFLDLGSGFSAQVGRKLLSFGKLNSVHPHQWDFADRPLVLEEYLGGHGSAGNGLNVSWLLPAPFFLQAEAGAWHVDAAHVHGDRPTASPADETYTARLSAGFPLGGRRELEIGVSGLTGNGSHYEDHLDRLRLFGGDLTFRGYGEGYRRLLLRGEILHADRKIPLGRQRKWGGYGYAGWRWDKDWDLGFRYDWVHPPFPEEIRGKERRASLILTRALSEMTRLRVQGYHNLDDDCGVLLQVLFGIGPHTHPLQ